MSETIELTYEQKVARLDEILSMLDISDTPIDKLAEYAEEGAKLIKELSQTLKQVDAKVTDVFKELDGE